MACGCLPRIFRKASPTCSLLEIVEAVTKAPDYSHHSTEAGAKLTPSEDGKDPLPEEKTVDVSLPQPQSTDSTRDSVKETEEKLPSSPAADKKQIDKNRRNVAPFFRNLFKPMHTEGVPLCIRCEFHIDEAIGRVDLKFKFEKWSDENSMKGTKGQTTNASPFMFLIRGRKKDEDTNDNAQSRRPSSSSKSESETDEPVDVGRPKERSVFCLRWGAAETFDDDDEVVAIATEAPPGLVGLVNLGNTCFLNAALQCLRCTPGFAGLVVPELKNGFEGVELRRIIDDLLDGSKRRHDRSHSASSLWPRGSPSWKWEGNLERRSLPVVLPDEIGGRLEGTGLAGGCIQRLPSVPDFKAVQRSAISMSYLQSSSDQVTSAENEASRPSAEEGDKKLTDNNEQTNNNASETVHRPSRDTEGNASECPSTSPNEQPSTSNNVSKGEVSMKEESEMELSANFISAFRKLVVEVCLGDAERHRSPRDLYQQLKKLPQGEWFCDGGQHDCQEVIKFLLDAIHANYVDVSIERPIDNIGRCMSDVSSDTMDALHAIELEILQANTLWKQYLSIDASPVTEVFAGQLQIVRTCQKCHCRSTTYEPFWDLSLSLSRERSGWFNPGRMPSSLDDLLRAFTAAEVLQGEEAPFCESCDQKSPATRRILIHRFPKVLVFNIKRFKYTKDGREKLTSNISFPMRALRLQNFASKEYQHGGAAALYDLYAVSNHYGTLGGGHYTAYCKVKDEEKKEGWYCFNDKAVNKMTEDAVVTPNAYILFYAKRPTDTVSNEA